MFQKSFSNMTAENVRASNIDSNMAYDTWTEASLSRGKNRNRPSNHESRLLKSFGELHT